MFQDFFRNVHWISVTFIASHNQFLVYPGKKLEKIIEVLVHSKFVGQKTRKYSRINVCIRQKQSINWMIKKEKLGSDTFVTLNVFFKNITYNQT